MKKLLFTFILLLTFGVSQAQKNVLVEELTGTWCQWCPGGIHYGDSLCFAYDNVIFIAIHTSDPMQAPDYAQASGLTGAPSANIGRHFNDININTWFAKVLQEMQITPKTSLETSCNYNTSSRQLTVTMTATALEHVSGDYRFGAILVEDGVTGPAPSYNQSNIYSGGNHGPMGGFEDMPNPIPAERIAYDHVGRALLCEYGGTANSFPTSLSAGATASYEISYQLPETYDYNRVRVVGLLIAPDGTIDNVAQSHYLNGDATAAPLFTSAPKTESYVNLNYLYNIYFHDTDTHHPNITLAEGPEWLTLAQYDHKSASLYGTPNVAGNYNVTLRLSDGEHITDQAFTIVVNEPLDAAWEYIGERAFSESSANTFGVEYDSQGNSYVFCGEGGHPVVYRYDGQDWTKISNISYSISVDGNNMTIDANDNLYIAFGESGASDRTHVMKWDGNNWSEVGTAFDGVESHVFLDHNGVPYLLTRDVHQDYKGAIFRLENGAWSPITGSGIYAPSNEYGLWHSMAFDSNNVPYIAYADYNANDKLKVIRLENGQWTQVGQPIERIYYSQSLAISNENEICVAICTASGERLNAYRFDGNDWQVTGEDLLNGSVSDITVKFVDGRFTIAANNIGQGNYLSVLQYDGTWNAVGPTLCSEGAISYPVINSVGDEMLVVFGDLDMGHKSSCLHYSQAEILFPPTDLQAELIQNDKVHLTWTAPQSMPLHYKVYRNNLFIATTEALEYTDENLAPGLQRYTVTAVYENGESTPAGPVTIETTLGIDEQNSQIVIYPLITCDEIHVESKTNGRLDIYNSNGQRVMSVKLCEGSNNIDVSRLAKGVYFIDNQRQAITKLIKY